MLRLWSCAWAPCPVGRPSRNCCTNGRAGRAIGWTPQLSARDALHAATALNRGIGAIISPDTDLDGIDGLERLDPIDAAALLV